MRFKELDEVQELGRYCPSATRLPARLSATGAEAPVICVSMGHSLYVLAKNFIAVLVFNQFFLRTSLVSRGRLCRQAPRPTSAAVCAATFAISLSITHCPARIRP